MNQPQKALTSDLTKMLRDIMYSSDIEIEELEMNLNDQTITVWNAIHIIQSAGKCSEDTAKKYWKSKSKSSLKKYLQADQWSMIGSKFQS
jgi:protein tyrosine/serine phosphatase